MTVYMKGMNGKMDNRPIGMFDSGVGGLTVFKEVKKQLPNENIVYLGDTKRFPYGSKSKESIIELTKQGIEFLIGQNVKLIVIACGTATSQALEEVKKIYSIPIIGIINLKQIDILKLDQYIIKTNSSNFAISGIIYCSYNSILLIPVLITLKKYITSKKY